MTTIYTLTERIPAIYCFQGSEFPLDLSFDNVLVVMNALQDEDVLPEDKIDIVINRFIGEIDFSFDDKLQVYDELICQFIHSEDKTPMEYDLAGNPLPKRKQTNPLSFYYDADLIFSGFMQAYGIDLEEEKGRLHWWKFRALLWGLPTNTRLKEIIEIRMRPYPTGKGTEKEREELKKLKKQFSWPGVDFSQMGGD